MNVLQRLSDILAKDGVKTSVLLREDVLPSMFESAKSTVKVNKRNNVVKEIPSKDVTIKENIHLVGRGSNLSKKVSREYLSPLQGHSIARHNILNNYDDAKASRMHSWIETVEKSPNSQEVLFTKFRQFTGDMLAALIACSPPRVKINSQNLTRNYLKYSTGEVPRIPNFQENPGLFEDYIGLLTHTRFLHKNSSSTNGIVPKILRNLMHPANIKTLHLRTTKCYNDMMYYFSEKFDFATCRELFVQMKVENVPPNTVTYNLLLRSVLKNSHIRKNKFPDEEVLFYLKSMKNRGIEADSVTWTTCYNFLKEDVSRLLFVEQLQGRGVPLTRDFIYTVLRNGDYNSTECLKFLTNNKIPLDCKSFKLCVSRLLQEDRVDVAWVFLEYTLKNSGRAFKLGADILNEFLRVFSAKGRLDLCLMTFNTCVQDRGLKPDVHTFDMLFKSLVRNGYHKNFCVMLTFLQNLKKKYGFEKRTNYWFIKAQSMAKFNIEPQWRHVTPEQLQRAQRWVALLRWGVDTNTFSTKVWSTHGTQFRNALRFIGCIPLSYRNSIQQDTAHLTRRKSEYRRRIRHIALQNALLKRVPYAKDWYGTLRKELKERGVVA
ncbi:hypothetical protein ZYGR_0S00780 [Zygosaccharomyces rouxii]|uniref:ZYRO0F04202p n=2 Tax=Zygosaccharomyces rouxii TaxID=4956 RepID=C5DXD7_ZYGRC|nr:uncharacterized protein ZYRO0F04202g [Zygosaccharomyces rouxii]KAH9199211.1 hypothetical protein LQ764DRAFT_216868 [Zygosaccharomyces rouxii]GAV49945.1 hypothetical protein ZYGR_0S00780 [Zygosaccharomyces rouxii]CAR28448.1 ZYRO0F04202p [Zygosaccharomyces rouxii]